MAVVKFTGVDLEFPVYDVSSLSLRNQIVTIATGGLVRSNNGVTKVQALRQVSFEARDGDSIGIVGHNGAGKTTLLRVIAGIYPQTAGVVTVSGKIGSVFELGAGLDHDIDGCKNIINSLLLKGHAYHSALKSVDEIVDFAELGDFINLPLRTYSSGMLLRLMFSIATFEMPEIFLLDEMFSTGDEKFQEKCNKRIESLINNSSVFFFSSHDLSLIKRYCNRVFKIHNGNLQEVVVDSDYVL
jgi:ABC-type polysaccharide/polyol phosphate transport system ATPase subunit